MSVVENAHPGESRIETGSRFPPAAASLSHGMSHLADRGRAEAARARSQSSGPTTLLRNFGLEHSRRRCALADRRVVACGHTLYLRAELGGLDLNPRTNGFAVGRVLDRLYGRQSPRHPHLVGRRIPNLEAVHGDLAHEALSMC
jgi:hypothetical protein